MPLLTGKDAYGVPESSPMPSENLSSRDTYSSRAFMRAPPCGWIDGRSRAHLGPIGRPDAVELADPLLIRREDVRRVRLQGARLLRQRGGRRRPHLESGQEAAEGGTLPFGGQHVGESARARSQSEIGRAHV